MDENHQDKTESKTPATEVKVSVPSEKKTGMPKCESQWPTTPAKWIELLGTPLTILIAVSGLLWGVYQFNAQQQFNSQTTLQQEEAAQRQALDQQQQTTLQNYVSTMSDLLIKENLLGSKQGDVVRQVAEAQTLTALQNLNPARKGILVNFLDNSRLIIIDSTPPIISLGFADLSNADLHGARLEYADLESADLHGANLSGAVLTDANLSSADLSGADLSKAFLSADLHGANLSGANLSKAYMVSAELDSAYLYGADLSGANLDFATNLSQDQLDQVKSCKGATLPPELTCNHNQ